MKKYVLILFCILGTLLPLYYFYPWVLSNGFQPQLLLTDILSSQSSIFLAVNLLISAALLFLLAFTDSRIGFKDKSLILVGTCFVGISLGLPLYLLLKSRERKYFT